jgi:hypothetical protein
MSIARALLASLVLTAMTSAAHAFTAPGTASVGQPLNLLDFTTTGQATELTDLVSPEEIAAELGLEANQGFLATFADPSSAPLYIYVDKSAAGQRMYIYENGVLARTVKISTGKEVMVTTPSGRRYRATTPVGVFKPTRMYRDYTSKTWGAPMPHAVFFNGGIALHATTHIGNLGSRASGGCVRQSPSDAKITFDTIRRFGAANTIIEVRSGPPQF